MISLNPDTFWTSHTENASPSDDLLDQVQRLVRDERRFQVIDAVCAWRTGAGNQRTEDRSV